MTPGEIVFESIKTAKKGKTVNKRCSSWSFLWNTINNKKKTSLSIKKTYTLQVIRMSIAQYVSLLHLVQ